MRKKNKRIRPHSPAAQNNPSADFITLLNKNLAAETSIADMYIYIWCIAIIQAIVKVGLNRHETSFYGIEKKDNQFPILCFIFSVTCIIQYWKKKQNNLTKTANLLLEDLNTFNGHKLPLQLVIEEMTYFTSQPTTKLHYTTTQLSTMNKKLRKANKKKTNIPLMALTSYSTLLTIFSRSSTFFGHLMCKYKAVSIVVLCKEFDIMIQKLPFTSDQLSITCSKMNRYNDDLHKLNYDQLCSITQEKIYQNINDRIAAFQVGRYPLNRHYDQLFGQQVEKINAICRSIEQSIITQFLYYTHTCLTILHNILAESQTFLKNWLGPASLLISSLAKISEIMPFILLGHAMLYLYASSLHYMNHKLIAAALPTNQGITRKNNLLTVKKFHVDMCLSLMLLQHLGCFTPSINLGKYQGKKTLTFMLPSQNPLTTYYKAQQTRSFNIDLFHSLYLNEKILIKIIKQQLGLDKNIEIKFEPNLTQNLITCTLNFSLHPVKEIKKEMQRISSSILFDYPHFSEATEEQQLLSWNITQIDINNLRAFIHERKKKKNTAQISDQFFTVQCPQHRRNNKGKKIKQTTLTSSERIRQSNLTRLDGLTSSTSANSYYQANDQVQFIITRIEESQQQTFLCHIPDMMDLFNDRAAPTEGIILQCYHMLHHKPLSRNFSTGAQSIGNNEKHCGKTLAPAHPTSPHFHHSFCASAFKLKWNNGARIVFQKIERSNTWLATSFYMKSNSKLTRCYEYENANLLQVNPT